MKFKARDNGVGINSEGGAGHHQCRRINSTIILHYAAFTYAAYQKTTASEVHLTV